MDVSKLRKAILKLARAARFFSVEKINQSRELYLKLTRQQRLGVKSFTGSFVATVLFLAVFSQVGALPDLFDTWNFSDISKYELSSGLEKNGSSVRLKGHELSNDVNTNALYRFDELTGSTATDTTTNNNTLTNSASSPWTVGRTGGAATIDATSYFTAPDSPSLSLNNNHSIETLVKFDSGFSNTSQGRQYVVDKGNYKLYYDNASGKLTYELAASTNTIASNNGPWGSSQTTTIADQVILGTDVYYSVINRSENGNTAVAVWRYASTTNTTAPIGDSTVATLMGGYNGVTIAASGSTLYIGLGHKYDSASSGYVSRVYSCDVSSDCTTLTDRGKLITGDSDGTVSSLYIQGGKLFASTSGSGPDSSALFVSTGTTTWSRIGGTGSTPASWTSASYSGATAVTGDGTNTLYIAVYLLTSFDTTISPTIVYRCVLSGSTCSSWTQISPSWSSSAAHYTVKYKAIGLSYFGGNLYARQNGAILRYSGTGTTWTTLTNPWAGSQHNGLVITNDGTNLYAATTSSTVSPNTGKVWKCTTPTSTCSAWTEITPATGAIQLSSYSSIAHANSSIYTAGTLKTQTGPTTTAKYANSQWQELGKPGTAGVSFSGVTANSEWRGDQYVGVGQDYAMPYIATAKPYGAFVYKKQGSTWTEIGGNGINGSWSYSSGEHISVKAIVPHADNLYVALQGIGSGDGEVWRWDGSSWTKVGGDGVNSSWASSFKEVHSLISHGNQLYAGLSGSAGDGEVWRWDGSSWTKVGGDGVNSSWSSSDKVLSFVSTNDGLYAGLGGATTSNGAIWRLNGALWSQLAGSGASTGNWNSAYEVSALSIYNGQVYAGVQQANGFGTYATIWQYTGGGTTWAASGGDTAPTSTVTPSRISAMTSYNGRLYAATARYGTSLSAQGYVWVSGASGFTKVSALSFPSDQSNILSMTVVGGALQLGIGGVYDDPDYGYQRITQSYSYGKNATLVSTFSNWDTAWHKVAASYNGTTMKLYVDGQLDASTAATTTVPGNTLPLLVGAGYEAIGTDRGSVGISIDELRLSNIALSSFPNYIYNNTAQTVTLLSAVHKNQIWHWDDWAQDAILNGGSIQYRFSIDEGATWLWWNGTAWTISTSTAQANAVDMVDSNIQALPVTFGGIMWQAVISGDGSQFIQLNSVDLAATLDDAAPSPNAANIQAKKTVGDTSNTLTNNGWTNGASPYFSWDAAQDASSGVLGYCLYLGQDATADVLTTKGMLGASPMTTGGNCQFIIDTPNIDLGTAGYLTAALTTSSTPYYLLISAIDNAGNITGASTQFQFRFDNTPPVNPAYITAPSGFVNNKEVNITWPSGGTNSPIDAHSGLSGLQYKINTSSWYGDSHTGTGDANDVLTNDGIYTTQPTPDFANLNEGINTVYVRTWDQAGNVSIGNVTALVKLNTAGAPSAPLDLSVTPPTNTINSFAFSWSRPSSFVGDPNNISYCYTVNALPNSSNCSYTPTNVTSLDASPYATQPGRNTMYVVARDEALNINYDTYASVDFTANTPAPGLPLNVDVADVSIKSTSNWRLAITWETPQDIGAGVTTYRILRSTDSVTFNQIGTSSSTSFIDTNLLQNRYYYHIVACDSANNCSAESAVAEGRPTGKYTTSPVLVSEPVVSGVTTRKATISWVTDREGDSRLSIGTTSGVYDPPETLLAAQVTNHSVSLNNLSAGTTYYVVAKWTDEDGNVGHSQELSFTTSPAPVVKEITTTNVGLSSAVINFTSIGAYRVAMFYGKSEDFGGTKSLNTSSDESNYSLTLDELDDGAKYFFQPVAYDSEGNAYPGNIFSFTTPERPQITNLRFQPVEGEPTSTQRVTWTTNVPTDSTITYGVVGSVGTDITKAQMTMEHEVQMNALEDSSVYFLVARSRDATGNLVVSDRQEFRTALDTRPPKISDIQVETSIRGVGSQSRGQIIVSWKTDEPATSQVAYGTGSDTKILNNKSVEDSALSTEHIVIVSDLPTSDIYTVQPLSQDKAGNQVGGESQTAIIGRASDDVLTIVLNTFKKLFGL